MFAKSHTIDMVSPSIFQPLDEFLGRVRDEPAQPLESSADIRNRVSLGLMKLFPETWPRMSCQQRQDFIELAIPIFTAMDAPKTGGDGR